MPKKNKETSKEEKERDELISILCSDKMYDFAGVLLPKLVGNYHEIKPISNRTEQELRAMAIVDVVTHFTAEVFSDDSEDGFLGRMLREENEQVVTNLYLYCNWRVFATYETDIEGSKKYQAVCDKIDGYVFDHWNKDKLNYFIRETD